MFGFNSAKYDLNLIKSYLLHILVNERDIEPTVIKKAKQFMSFKFGDIQLLDKMNFLGGASSLDSFLKTYKTLETKRFVYEWFVHPDKMQNTELSPYGASYSKLRSCYALEAECTDYVNLLKSDWPQNKPLSNWNYQSHPLLVLRIINTCNNDGSRNKLAHS